MSDFVKEKIILPTHELYEVEPSIFYDMSYPDALKLKIELAKKLIAKLNKEHYLKRDSNKITKALSAIKFNETLLKEMGVALK